MKRGNRPPVKKMNKMFMGKSEEDLRKLRESSGHKKWIKIIPQAKTIKFDDYNRKEYFKLVADIILDDEVYASGKKQGEIKRNTVIRFVPTIPMKDYKDKDEWIYIFVLDGNIVKIGGTRTGLYNRTASYICGHYTTERGGSDKCSVTNAFIYNTFEFYLKHGSKIQMYGYKLPKYNITIDILGKNEEIFVQTFHAYESVFMADYKKKYKHNPFLSDNSDPDYK